MDNLVEKVYVALGNDLPEGFKTLDWTITKWKPQSISIVILHVSGNFSLDFVDTPFGKLPASSLSEEKLEAHRRYEQGKMEMLLSKYKAFCGEVKAEILKVEGSDEPIQNVMVDLISRHKITKLVMGITFVKSNAWKSKNAISESFYINQNKPNFCELFIICGGKLVFLKGENEHVFVEDDQGVSLSRRSNLTSWFGKKFTERYYNSQGRQGSQSLPSAQSLVQNDSQNQWELFAQAIEAYFEHLLSLNLDTESIEDQSDTFQIGSREAECTANADTSMSVEETMERRRKMDEVQKLILLKREETKANAERSAKAERAICLCNVRVEELEAMIKEEVINRIELTKDKNIEKEKIQEIKSDIEESKNRLSSLAELQSELSNKLQMSSLGRVHVEAQLEKAVLARQDMVREIEELRRQRDILQQRIEFCKEKDAIGMAAKLGEVSRGYREYSAEDIRSATDDFSERQRLKSRNGDYGNVYQGHINHLPVAIRRFTSDDGLSQEKFLAKVKVLSHIQHPHLVAMLGFCAELQCVIFEYMHHCSLMEVLFSSPRNNREKNPVLMWNDRIRVAHEVCIGLVFLHTMKPKPIMHGHLTTSSILLDCNLVAKITGFGMLRPFDECGVQLDIRAFGILLIHLLAGTNWAGLADEATTTDQASLTSVLDEMAGQWPLDLAEELVGIARKCLFITREPKSEISLLKVREQLGKIRKRADDAAAGGECGLVANQGVTERNSEEVPHIFLCPIFQEVMKDPHVAADGFSYELESIDEWLKMGRDTSPMTNLTLSHKVLTPNHILRSLIQEWQNKKPNVL